MVRRASPVRTCVGCRRRAPASELLRVVAVERATMGHDTEPPGRVSGAAVFSVVPDPGRRRPGRGAHLHPDPDCLALAERRRAFGRALRIPGVLDTGLLSECVMAVAKAGTRPTVAASGISEQPMVGNSPPRIRKVGRST